MGDAGADRFDFNAAAETAPGASRDAVRDFETGLDVIDLKGIDADRDTAGNQAFAWVARGDLDAAFTGQERQLRFDNGLLTGDTDGDRKADFQIAVAGRLSAGDVLL